MSDVQSPESSAAADEEKCADILSAELRSLILGSTTQILDKMAHVAQKRARERLDIVLDSIQDKIKATEDAMHSLETRIEERLTKLETSIERRMTALEGSIERGMNTLTERMHCVEQLMSSPSQEGSELTTKQREEKLKMKIASLQSALGSLMSNMEVLVQQLKSRSFLTVVSLRTSVPNLPPAPSVPNLSPPPSPPALEAPEERTKRRSFVGEPSTFVTANATTSPVLKTEVRLPSESSIVRAALPPTLEATEEQTSNGLPPETPSTFPSTCAALSTVAMEKQAESCSSLKAHPVPSSASEALSPLLEPLGEDIECPAPPKALCVSSTVHTGRSSAPQGMGKQLESRSSPNASAALARKGLSVEALENATGSSPPPKASSESSTAHVARSSTLEAIERQAECRPLPRALPASFTLSPDISPSWEEMEEETNRRPTPRAPSASSPSRPVLSALSKALEEHSERRPPPGTPSASSIAHPDRFPSPEALDGHTASRPPPQALSAALVTSALLLPTLDTFRSQSEDGSPPKAYDSYNDIPTESPILWALMDQRESRRVPTAASSALESLLDRMRKNKSQT